MDPASTEHGRAAAHSPEAAGADLRGAVLWTEGKPGCSDAVGLRRVWGMARRTRLQAMSFRLEPGKPRLGRAVADETARNREREHTERWRKLYRTARWAALRLKIFKRDLFTCRMCRRVEGDTSLLACDHIQPHHGDERLFWDEDNLQTLCKPCHDGTKQSEERRGRGVGKTSRPRGR